MKFLLNLALALVLATGLWSCSATSTGFSLPTEKVDFTGNVELNKKVDILFVVDNTASMLQHQRNISAQLQNMTASLNSLKMDYRVAVTTTSMGSATSKCANISRRLVGNPVYLTEENINLLPDRLIVGDSGCDLEKGIDALAWVTSPSYLGAIKSDFFRRDALFIINFIGDEDDASIEFGDSKKDDFINLLNERKPAFSDGSRGWIANFIGTLSMNNTCDTGGGLSSVGKAYMKLVEYSKGVNSSICTLEMAKAVSNIKARIIDHLRAYRFKEEPNKSTISVVIGGRTILEDPINGWSLQTESRADGKDQFILKFNGDSVPKADEPVNVVYKPANAT